MLKSPKGDFPPWDIEQEVIAQKKLPGIHTSMGAELDDGKMAEQLAAKIHHGVGAPRWQGFAGDLRELGAPKKFL